MRTSSCLCVLVCACACVCSNAYRVAYAAGFWTQERRKSPAGHHPEHVVVSFILLPSFPTLTCWILLARAVHFVPVMQASSDFDKRMRARCDAEWESAAPKMKQNPKNAVNMLQKNRLEKRIAAFKEELAGWKRAEEAAAKAADGGASSSSSSSSSSSAAAAGGADDENAMPPEQLLTAEEQGFLEGRVEAAALRSKVAGTVNKAAMQTDRLHKMVRDSKKLEAECAKSQHQLTGALHERAFDGLPQVRNPKAIIKSILSFPGGAAAAVEGETPGAAAVDRA